MSAPRAIPPQADGKPVAAEDREQHPYVAGREFAADIRGNGVDRRIVPLCPGNDRLRGGYDIPILQHDTLFSYRFHDGIHHDTGQIVPLPNDGRAYPTHDCPHSF